MTTLDDLVTHQYVQLQRVRLHVVTAGQGPLVLMLHGFPDFWYSWRYQIPALVAAGFSVVACDLPGYNRSERLGAVRDYDARLIARDIEGLVRWAGAERAFVVGHDWGAIVAWYLAMQAPLIVERLVILDVPHPRSMVRGLRSLRQLRKSWYVFACQIPWIPEASLTAGRFALLQRILRTDPSSPTAFTPDDIERYVEAWSQPGGLTGGINYYRALRYRSPRSLREDVRPIHTPTLVIWGEQERYLDLRLAEPPVELVPDARVHLLPEASHWVHMDAPDRVNDLLISFFKEP